MKKVLLTATVQSHIAQFHRPLIELLHEHGYEVHVAARNNLEEKNGLSLDFVDKVYEVPFSRSPRSLDNLRAYKELKRILRKEYYDFIHCNTPMGGIITRLAAGKTRKKGTHVIYTAHGFHFYKGAPLKNWLVFYPIERVMAHFCDILITITKEDYKLASKKFRTRVEHIHGVGVYTDRYHPISDIKKSSMRYREGLGEKDYIILCIGELNKNKNQKTLIEAAGQLKETIPNLKVLIAGNGPMENNLREQIRRLELDEQVRLLGYRTDLENITPAVDLVVSCSYREGMPLNIVEAMLCEKPVLVSANRGHRELVRNGYNGYLVRPDNAAEYKSKIAELYQKQNEAVYLGKNGYNHAKKYTANYVKKELHNIYRFLE